MKEIKICQAEGCDRQVIKKGYCHKHYSRLWKNGTLEVKINGTYPRKEKFCIIEGCKNKHYAKGLCQMHYRRKLRQEKIKNMLE